jgi:hypothetical protein
MKSAAQSCAVNIAPTQSKSRPSPDRRKALYRLCYALKACLPGTLVPQGALRLGSDQPGLRYRGLKANGAHNP